MLRFDLCMWAIAALFSQETATLPQRVGDIAQQLVDSDLAVIERMAFPSGGKPWLIFGIHRGGGQDFFDVYLNPKTQTSEVRRGPMVNFIWSPALVSRGHSVSSSKTTTLSYAQVAAPGGGFEVQSARDLSRPFQVLGSFSDTELIRIVALLRSKPYAAAGNRNVPSCPILSLSRDADDSVTVRLDPATQPPPANIARVILQRTGDVWVVAQIVVGQA